MPRAKITFSPILPKEDFTSEVYKEEWEKAMRNQVKPDLRNFFKDTVDGWEEKPIFRGTINKSTEFLRLLVKPIGKNAPLYAMIDITGAKKHIIHAHPNSFLFYRPGYTAATKPRVLKSRRKRRSGPIVTARMVKHPGFAAREFSSTISKEYQERYVKIMDAATKRAAAKFNTKARVAGPVNF